MGIVDDAKKGVTDLAADVQGTTVLRDPAGLLFERFSDGKILRLRTRHVADSGMDRIFEATKALQAGGDAPPIATVVSMDLVRGEGRDLHVTKQMSDGTVQQVEIHRPQEFETQQPEQALELEGPAPIGSLDIASNAAMGGTALDTILKGE